MAGTATSGRQSATVEAERDVREELRAHLAESWAFAHRVRNRVKRIGELVAAGYDAAAINEAGMVGYDADRRLEQLGSVVLTCLGCPRAAHPGLLWCAGCVLARFFGGTAK